MAKGYRQGWFIPKHPEKYVGNLDNIRFMSSWELATHKFLDNNPNVLQWSSEEIIIPYIKPTDGKIHKYYVDYWISYQNKSGKIVEELWEVKPKNQVYLTRRGKSKKRQLVESITYAINKAKWTSAEQYCRKRGWKFRIITEQQLFK